MDLDLLKRIVWDLDTVFIEHALAKQKANHGRKSYQGNG